MQEQKVFYDNEQFAAKIYSMHFGVEGFYVLDLAMKNSIKSHRYFLIVLESDRSGFWRLGPLYNAIVCIQDHGREVDFDLLETNQQLEVFERGYREMAMGSNGLTESQFDGIWMLTKYLHPPAEEDMGYLRAVAKGLAFDDSAVEQCLTD